MKVNPIGRLLNKARIRAGICLLVLAGLAETWMFWRMGTRASCVTQRQENTARFCPTGGNLGLP